MVTIRALKKGGYEWGAWDVALLSGILICCIAGVLVGLLDAAGRFPPERFYDEKQCVIDTVSVGPSSCCKPDPVPVETVTADPEETTVNPQEKKTDPEDKVDDPDCPETKGLMVNVRYTDTDGTSKPAMLHHTVESREYAPQHTFAECGQINDDHVGILKPQKRYRRQSPGGRGGHHDDPDPEHHGPPGHHGDSDPDRRGDRDRDEHEERDPEHQREPERPGAPNPERNPEDKPDCEKLDGRPEGKPEDMKPTEDSVYSKTLLFTMENMYKKLASVNKEFPCLVDIEDAGHAVMAPPRKLFRKYRHVIFPMAIGMILLVVLVSRRLCCARKVVNHVTKKREIYKVPEPWMTTNTVVNEKDPSVLGAEVVAADVTIVNKGKWEQFSQHGTDETATKGTEARPQTPGSQVNFEPPAYGTLHQY